MRTFIAAAAAALAVAGAAIGQAEAGVVTFGFDEPRRAGNQTAGAYEALRFTFDDGQSGPDDLVYDPTLDVSGSVRLNTEVGIIDGGWFALTPGGDPRRTDEQIAIFYMDFVTGRISAYRYDGSLGVNGIRTYENEDLFITTYEDAVQTTIRDGVLSFRIADLDVTAVQQASDAEGYTGVAFGEEIGIWLHLSVMRRIGFDDQGRLTVFHDGALASFDLPRAPANPIPLPGAAVFALTGLAGLFGVKRLKRG